MAKTPKQSKAAAAAGTPATVALKKAQIPFATHEYAHDPAAASYGTEAAEAMGVDPSRVFKTLVADVDGKLTVAVVPVSGTLDLKALASAVGGKKAAMADPAAAERSSGYVLGGISPLGHPNGRLCPLDPKEPAELEKRRRLRMPTVIDITALSFPTMFVSAGKRGMEIELSPGDLVTLTGAVTAPIGRE